MELKMFPALLISLKFLKVKQVKVNRKLTNNSETLVLQKFQFYRKVSSKILIKINTKSRWKSEERGKMDAGQWESRGTNEISRMASRD